MHKTIKLIIIIVGIVLLAYGVYTLIVPEASVSLGPLSIQAQDNTNAYIAIGIGLITLFVGTFVNNIK
ncbi:hypothetical protein [uncultured Dokdonia sp.]|uniref:hypothetical protein n=1 Tax=uncultured Dokdonia sp. TaxID=575653 RepID=UPI002625D286|nr:hypothetical protein [uncultured Dokdonia sp.]